jgi:hypothetical protein
LPRTRRVEVDAHQATVHEDLSRGLDFTLQVGVQAFVARETR